MLRSFLTFCCCSVATMTLAQSADDSRYLAGAVPEEDGKIVFATTIATPSLSAEDAYDRMYNLMTTLVASPEQTNKSVVALHEKDSCYLVGTYVERLVLTKRALQLDTTDFGYTMVVACHEGSVDIRFERLYFVYTWRSTTEHLSAESTIADSVLLTKDGTQLKKYNSRFRRATVDRMLALLAACHDALGDTL